MSNSSRIQGCNIKNIGKSSGVYLYSSNYSVILDNNIYNSLIGIQLGDSSDYSRIDNNTFSFLSEGILLSSGSNYNKINCTNKFYINNPCKITGDKLENHICERYRVCTSS